MEVQIRNAIHVLGALFVFIGIVATFIVSPDVLTALAFVGMVAGLAYMGIIGIDFTEFLVNNLKRKK
jgi:hypothetical protein